MVDLPTGTLTMLFSDIEGSTQLLSRLGDRYGEALSAQRSILRHSFARRAGVEMGTEGDSFFVVFPTAVDAVHACMDGQRAMREHPWPEGIEVRVRMGVHTGEPTRHEDGYFGIDVHRAARIAGTAHGGQVVVSAATTEVVAGGLPEGVKLADLGWHRLKDLPDAERIYQLTAPGLTDEFPPIKSLGTRSNLPQSRQPLIGRTHEVEAIEARLGSGGARLITLTGTGGTGKTRLALEVAARTSTRFASGVYFVALESADDPASMWSTIASTLGTTGDSPAEAGVRCHLADREALLVLDNLEQIDAAGTVVGALLDASSRIAVLATSRRPLHVTGEHEWPVTPLTIRVDWPDDPAIAAESEAVAFFVQQMTMVRPGFTLTTENVGDVVAICQQLDGLPLAIELTTARGRMLSPRALLEHLRDASGPVGGAERPDRQRSLQAAIAWSIDLLDDHQRRALRLAAVFNGGFDLDAFGAVVAGGDAPTSPLDIALGLVENNLLRASDGPTGEPRLGMLQTIRQHLMEQLEAGELDEASARHASHYLASAERIAPRLRSADQLAAFDRLETEHDNLRAALAWSLAAPGDSVRTTLAMRLVGALSRFWYGHGHVAEGRRWLEAAITVADATQTAELAQALHGLGVLVLQQGEPHDADLLLERSLALWRDLGDRHKEAQELNSLGVVRRMVGDLDASRSLHLRAISLGRELGDDGRVASALSNLAITELDRGDIDSGVRALQEALTIDRRLGDTWGVTIDQSNLATALWRGGRVDEAHTLLSSVVDEVVRLGDVELLIEVVEIFAAIAAEQQEPERACLLAGAADAMRLEAGMPISAPDAGHLERSFGPARDAFGREAWEEWEAAGRRLARGELISLISPSRPG